MDMKAASTDVEERVVMFITLWALWGTELFEGFVYVRATLTLRGCSRQSSPRMHALCNKTTILQVMQQCGAAILFTYSIQYSSYLQTFNILSVCHTVMALCANSLSIKSNQPKNPTLSELHTIVTLYRIEVTSMYTPR